LAHREQKKEVLTSLYIENNPTTDAQFEEYRAILEKSNDKTNMTLPI
jgi:16S rRNA G527 N7-methylase RsmG